MKKALSVFLVFVMLVTAVAVMIPLDVSADALYVKKIVSVVYDDSGSMSSGTDNWAYANYAMQAFCGLLNSEDEVYITYMSRVDQAESTIQLDLSDGKLQGSIDSVKNHFAKGGTPYKAVELAMEKLRNIKNTNENTQYWLVVISDGEFVYDGAMITRNQLDKQLSAFASETMANNTTPQITYLSIGNNVTVPTQNEEKGIYVYRSSGANDIVSVMSGIADKVSGRYRLKDSDVDLVNDRTVRIHSDIPLINIAVLTQGNSARVSSASYEGGKALRVNRSVSITCPSLDGVVPAPSLQAGGVLIDNPTDVIDDGTYEIVFDQKIDVEDIVIMFEPALEVRLNVLCNGIPVADLSELQNVAAGDRISVSYNVYEVGTDKPVDLDLLPEGTECRISILEDGNAVVTETGSSMNIRGYVLKECTTEIRASVMIDGFNPIEFSTVFTPAESTQRAVYTVEASYGSETRSLMIDEIAGNTDLTVEFSVFVDGVRIEDPASIEDFAPQITLSPSGNDGTMTIERDGTIVFTPNKAPTVESGVSSYNVTVTCSVNGAKDSATYEVRIPQYNVVAVEPDEAIVKTEFFGNEVGVSFYVTKDGVKLDKNSLESEGFTVRLGEQYSHLMMNVTVSEDGTVHCVPYDAEEHVLTFGSWWSNWLYYGKLEGSDVSVHFETAHGNAEAKIEVCGAASSYWWKNVFAPLLTILVILALIIAYFIRFITKPRFDRNGVLYVGTIEYLPRTPGYHHLSLREISLGHYNQVWRLLNPFKDLTIKSTEFGISVTAGKGYTILCNEPFPWISCKVTPKVPGMNFKTPEDIVAYCMEKESVLIDEIKFTSVMDEQNNRIAQDDSTYYFVDINEGVKPGRNKERCISSAMVFYYTVK